MRPQLEETQARSCSSSPQQPPPHPCAQFGGAPGPSCTSKLSALASHTPAHLGADVCRAPRPQLHQLGIQPRQLAVLPPPEVLLLLAALSYGHLFGGGRDGGVGIGCGALSCVGTGCGVLSYAVEGTHVWLPREASRCQLAKQQQLAHLGHKGVIIVLGVGSGGCHIVGVLAVVYNLDAARHLCTVQVATCK